MNGRPRTLEELDSELRRATTILDQCATAIRDIPFDPACDHIKRIGDALVNVFEIQHKIYELKPELTPEFLKNAPPEKDKT